MSRSEECGQNTLESFSKFLFLFHTQDNNLKNNYKYERKRDTEFKNSRKNIDDFYLN